MTDSTDAAWTAWDAILGADRARRDPETLARYSRTTLPTAPPPAGVLLPRDRDDVVAVVKVATEHGVPLYPVSTGKNWGLGETCPVTAGQVVLDLGELNRIVEVNEELAYAVVEPGVTQGQLSDYLLEHEIPLIMDCTGAGRQTSILANCLERGDGLSPYGDRFLNCCGLEVVLADGTLIRTGMGHYPNTSLGPLHKWGNGPSLDGLFSQSNMGIVTALAFWLMPDPDDFAAFLVTVEQDTGFEALVEALRPLRLNGTIQCLVHVFNDLRVLAGQTNYPWDAAGGKTPLPDELRQQLRRSARVGAWNAWGGVYGSRRQVRAHLAEIRSAMRGVGKVRVITINRLTWAGRLLRLLRFLRLPVPRSLELGLVSLRKAIGLLVGIPSDDSLLATRWRCRGGLHPTSLDPLDNNVGMNWLTPLCAATGAEGRRLLTLLYGCFARHGFEPHLTCTLLNGRAMLMATTVFYNRADPAETDRARACADELMGQTIAAGFIPFRVGVDGMHLLDPGSSTYWPLVRRIKEALDPAGIIAPGRYAPWETDRPD